MRKNLKMGSYRVHGPIQLHTFRYFINRDRDLNRKLDKYQVTVGKMNKTFRNKVRQKQHST